MAANDAIDAVRKLTASYELRRWTRLFSGPVLVTRYHSEARGRMTAAEVAKVEEPGDEYPQGSVEFNSSSLS